MENHRAKEQVFARPHTRLLIGNGLHERFITSRPLRKTEIRPTEKSVLEAEEKPARSMALVGALAMISRERKSTMSMKETLRQLFMDGNTGLDRLIVTYNSRIRFSVWSITYSVLAGSMFYFIYTDFKKFFEYPTVSAAGLREPESTDFPAVTICNLNYLNRSTFCRHQEALDEPREQICRNKSIERADAFSFVADGLRNPGSRNTLRREDILRVISKHSMRWNNTMLRCHLSGRNCRSEAFIERRVTTNPEYGECFTLFSESVRLRASKETGNFETVEDSESHLGGLHLILDARNVDYVPFLLEEGFVLMVHGSRDDADVSEQGIMIPTNRVTYIGLEKRIISLMEAPYNTRCHPSKDWPQNIVELDEVLAAQIADEPYSTPSCEYICRAFNLALVCGCETKGMSFDFALLCNEEQNWRDPITNLTCKEEFTAAPRTTARKHKKAMPCRCPNRCRDVMYRTEVSYAAFTKSMGSIERDKLRGEQIFHRRYAEVFVFFKSMLENEVNITPAFTLIMMITEIGGFIGCFVGMAFMNIYEILENFLIALSHRSGCSRFGQYVV